MRGGRRRADEETELCPCSLLTRAHPAIEPARVKAKGDRSHFRRCCCRDEFEEILLVVPKLKHIGVAQQMREGHACRRVEFGEPRIEALDKRIDGGEVRT